jgi:hypothetical protein
MIIKYDTVENSRVYISEKIKAEKIKNSNYTVIDIGGVTNVWTLDIIDLLVDINTTDTLNSLSVDICSTESLVKLQTYVEEHGMFDYAICTHTLEDIFNPIDILKILPTIAKRGVISMPSANTEFSRCENPHWLGYIHHRWIFDQTGTTMLIIPKISVLEALCSNRFSYKKAQEEIRYEWETSIPYTLFMDNYLGPSAAAVINHYTALIETIYNRKI